MTANAFTQLQHRNGHSTLAKHPISVVLTSSGVTAVQPGSTHILGVTVHNQGGQDAVILLFINERSPKLRRWCRTMQKQLALAADQTGEVIFEFHIPPSASPEQLGFDLGVDASDSYPSASTYWSRNHQLQVQAREQIQRQSSDPAFQLEPITSPSQPLTVQPGIATPLEVWVENRSERVDRFRLLHSGLPQDWKLKVTYPKDRIGLGLVTQNDSLGLNPGDRGQILVTVTPPAHALAGHYIPTFRLQSSNHTQLGLLELVYLNVDPVYTITPQIQALKRNVRTTPARFEVNLANLGNTDRRIHLQLENLDDQQQCTYRLAQDEVKISPRSIAQIAITGMPQGRWSRPWFGAGKPYNFRIQLSDKQNHTLTPRTLESHLILSARPWWQPLLIALLALGMVGTLVLIILALLSPKLPKILEFAAEDSHYSALNEEVARVGWRIHHPAQLRALRITGYGAEGNVRSGPIEYDLSEGLPITLQSFCRQQQSVLSCNSIRTDALEAGQYTFELALLPKAIAQEPIVKQSQSVTIAAKPIPQVKKLLPSQLTYGELGSRDEALPTIGSEGILLNWAITDPNQLAALRLTGQTEEGTSVGELIYEFPQFEGETIVPTELTPYCQIQEQLICRNLPTGLSAVGRYQFQLQAIPKEAVEPPKALQSEAVTIQARSPQILNFLVNGYDALPKYQIPVHPGTLPPSIMLSWEVDAGSSTQVSLLPSPGHVPAQGTLNLPLPPQGSTTVTLQIMDINTGKTSSRAITFETFDPHPSDPAEVAAAAAAAAANISSRSTAALMERQNAVAAAMMANQAAQLSETVQSNDTSQSSVITDTTANGSTVAPVASPSLQMPPRLAPSEVPPLFN